MREACLSRSQGSGKGQVTDLRHPCHGCHAYREKRPVGKVRCPLFSSLMEVDNCRYIAGEHWMAAQKRVEAVKGLVVKRNGKAVE